MTARGIYTTGIGGRHFSVPRWISIVTGCWLVISAFVWSQAENAQANRIIVGILVGTVALFGIFVPAARVLNSAIAVWLLASSTLLFGHVVHATLWSDVLVAILVFAMSLVPDRASPEERPELGTRAL